MMEQFQTARADAKRPLDMAYLRYGPTKSFYLRLKLFEFDKIRTPLFFNPFHLAWFAKRLAITDSRQIAQSNPGAFLDPKRQRRPLPKPARQKSGHKERPVAHRRSARSLQYRLCSQTHLHRN